MSVLSAQPGVVPLTQQSHMSTTPSSLGPLNKRQVIEFLCNQCFNMVCFKNYFVNLQAQLERSYVLIFSTLIKCYEDNEPEVKSLHAEVMYRLGMYTYIAGGNDAREQAEVFFREAFCVRASFITKYPKNDPLYWKHKSILKTVVATQLRLNLTHDKIDDEIVAAQMQWLIQFTVEANQRGDRQAYNTEDTHLLMQVNAYLSKVYRETNGC